MVSADGRFRHFGCVGVSCGVGRVLGVSGNGQRKCGQCFVEHDGMRT